MGYRRASEIVEDTDKGASELLMDAVESLKELEENEVEDYLDTLIKNRYSMTPLLNLANRIFLSIDKGKQIDPELESFEKEFVSKKSEVIDEMKELLTRRGYDKILTFSYSSTVLESLSDSEKVVVLESRPKKEGRVLAKNLSDENVKVEFWIDAGMCKAMDRLGCVVVGADTISVEGFLNKIGTRPLAILAEELNKEFFVVADSSKILPSEIPVPREEKHPPREVWDTEKNIQVKNDYFELTSLRRGKFVTEEGLIDSKKIKKLAKEKEVSDRLIRSHPLL